MPDMPLNPDIINASKANTKSAIRAYLGGSFDPVHNGHIEMATYVHDCLLPIAEQQQRALHVSLLPNARSPFKQDSTDAAHRLVMLKLATQNTTLQISEFELWQTPPVYTIDTVRALHLRYPNDSLIFIMGMDSARSLAQWKDGLQLTDYVHLWIFDRNDNSDVVQTKQFTYQNINTKALSTQDIAALYAELPIQLQAQLTKNSVDLTQTLGNGIRSIISEDEKPLKSNTQGRIYIDTRPVPAVSSTHIREKLRQQLQKTDIANNNKPNIAHNKSTNIAYLLNPAVYQYIIAHQLYSAAQFR